MSALGLPTLRKVRALVAIGGKADVRVTLFKDRVRPYVRTRSSRLLPIRFQERAAPAHAILASWHCMDAMQLTIPSVTLAACCNQWDERFGVTCAGGVIDAAPATSNRLRSFARHGAPGQVGTS